jgi:flagellar basal-body rod protein FlgB
MEHLMAKGIDSIFNPHSQALRLLEQRLNLIGGNLANASTPGYKARDLDFSAAMKQVQSSERLDLAAAGGPTLPRSAEGAGFVQYRSPLQPSLDGNTVDTQVEKSAFAEASVRYESTLSLLSRRISGLRAVLKGE